MTQRRNNANYRKLPRVIQQILLDRGFSHQEDQHRFLFPSLADLPSPDEMYNLEEGAGRVVTALLEKKQIVIWGDYDVDGTTGTSLLVIFFKLLGIEVIWHIPNRLEEGYGLNVEWFAENRSRIGNDFLLITVDCGTSDTQAINHIKAMGGEVVVTDHHAIPSDFQASSILINPSQTQCLCNNHSLAGVGVAFYLAAAIRKILATHQNYSSIYENINLKELMPLVALGTVSDIVELTPVNRILVRAGMEAMKTCKLPGLNALLESCDINDGLVSTEDIGFLIGPKINAAGRLGESRLVVSLFTETDPGRARRLAKKLVAMNEERKRLTETSLETALRNISLENVKKDKCVLVCNSCHRGVAGIVASKLVDRFRVPAVVMTEPEDDFEELLVGSARSIEGINLLAIIEECAGYLEKYGGHSMAAGISLRKKNLNQFLEQFKKSASRQMVNLTKPLHSNNYDIECSLEELIADETLSYYRLLEPFGPGNLQPIFKANQVVIIDSRTVGYQAEHLNLTIRSKYNKIKGIGFQLGSRLDEVQKNPQRDLIITPTQNRFRGTTSWQLRILDFQ